MDFVHAFTSVFVFTAITLSENNTVKCFFPSPSRDSQQILTAVPVGIGVASSFVFVLFLAQRHGIIFYGVMIRSVYNYYKCSGAKPKGGGGGPTLVAQLRGP
ncbi:Protein DMP4 [Bienertia sinuspersici]